MKGTEDVLEQYDSKRGLQFYRTVMGDGGSSIHYGMYHQPDETMEHAVKNTMFFMARQAERYITLDQNSKILDLGSGVGAASHFLTEKYGCATTCVNISPNQNALNIQQAAALGIEHLIEIEEVSFDSLPEEWDSEFDLVWSEEAFCHGADKLKILQDVRRVLNRQGVCVFTDIMAGERAGKDELASFTQQNAVTDLARPSEYFSWALDVGFSDVRYYDFSSHLVRNFEKMISQIDENFDVLLKQDVPAEYMSEFRNSLVRRIQAVQAGTFSWGCFCLYNDASSASFQ